MMASSLLLDTCAAIWITENEELDDAAVDAVDAAYRAGLPVFVSPITAWERALLSALGRMSSPLQPLTWFERLVRDSKLSIAQMSPAILVDAWFLPGRLHRDPADRILVATARALDLTLITRDRPILNYADQGHVRALAC
jgi:PIN domain nuclease of toxin-antitoxin system